MAISQPNQKNFHTFFLEFFKVGGESLLGDREYGISPQAALTVAKQNQRNL